MIVANLDIFGCEITFVVKCDEMYDKFVLLFKIKHMKYVCAWRTVSNFEMYIGFEETNLLYYISI